MSGGLACRCPESKRPIPKRNWLVLQRHCNYSAFNGYRYTYSDYSCLQFVSCKVVWRTKAAYASKLSNSKGELND